MKNVYFLLFTKLVIDGIYTCVFCVFILYQELNPNFNTDQATPEPSPQPCAFIL